MPQRQKSKGSLIVTAALELSTNQITHFYSEKKNTDEMIKLLMLLLARVEVISVISHPLLPESGHRRARFLHWIKKFKPELVVTCPVTKREYLRAIDSVDELADRPDHLWAPGRSRRWVNLGLGRAATMTQERATMTGERPP